jgi:hypothetical protein
MTWNPTWEEHRLAYRNVHPPEATRDYIVMEQYLQHVCSRIMVTWHEMKTLAAGGTIVNPHTTCGLNYDRKNPLSALWLFQAEGKEIDYADLLNLIIRVRDFDLSPNDYALLLFLEYQDSETKNLLKGLPMSMLRETYQPLMDAHHEEWKKFVLV